MSTLLVATKFFAPPKRENSIERPRLTQGLEASSKTILNLVLAPAGFGKSSAIRDWIGQKSTKSTWIGLLKDDRDVYRFMSVLIEAIQVVEPDFGEQMLYLLGSPNPPHYQTIVETLVNEISRYPDSLVLVLDDYYLAQSEEVDELISRILSLRMPRFRLVISSREEPRFALGKFRSEGLVAELGQADLALNTNELRALCQASLDCELDDGDITTLHEKTEGWIAGLQLAIISMRGHTNPKGFIASFGASHGHIEGYLLEEVMDRQSEEVKQFLISTSILPRFSAPVCNALVQQTTSAQIIAYLLRSNIFVIPLDGEGKYYRYHHLFHDLVRRRLTDETFVHMLFDRAINWHLSRGLDLEAFELAKESDDIGRVLFIVEGRGMPFYFRGFAKAVIDWVNGLSKPQSDRHPRVYLCHAWALMMSGRPSLVEEKLRAFEFVHKEPEGEVMALRALVAASLRRVESLIPQALEALDHLAPTNIGVRTCVNCTLAAAYQFLGQTHESKTLFREVIDSGLASGNIMFAAAGSVSLGQHLEREYKLYEAEQVYFRAFDLITDPDHLVGCELHLGLARIGLERGDFDQALKHMDTGERLSAQLECEIQLSASLIRARLYRAQGNLRPAVRVLDLAIQKAKSFGFDFLIESFSNLRVRCLIELGALTEAQGSADQFQSLESSVRILLARSRYAEAYELLNSSNTIDALTRGFLEIQILVGSGKIQEACDTLEGVFELTMNGAFVQSFVDEGEPLVKVLEELGKKGKHRTEIDRILVNRPVRASVRSQGLIEPLSERELEVLELIDRGLSNQDIGQKLFISLSTVKWHNQKIFEKLQVKRRTEALVRARDLGLFD